MDKFRFEQVCMLAIAAITGAVMAIALGIPTWTFSERGAAWVQTAATVLALAVAIAAPIWHEQKKAEVQRVRWISTFKTLARAVSSMGRMVYLTYSDRSHLMGAIHFGNRDEYAGLLHALDAFPTFELTNPSHMTSLVEIRSIAMRLNRLWHRMMDEGEEAWLSIDAPDTARELWQESVKLEIEIPDRP